MLGRAIGSEAQHLSRKEKFGKRFVTSVNSYGSLLDEMAAKISFPPSMLAKGCFPVKIYQLGV